MKISFSGLGASTAVALCLPAEGAAAVPSAGIGAVLVGLACGTVGAILGDKIADGTITVVETVIAPTLGLALGFTLEGSDADDPCDGLGETVAHLGSCFVRGVSGAFRP